MEETQGGRMISHAQFAPVWICWDCYHRNLLSVVICAECGAKLKQAGRCILARVYNVCIGAINRDEKKINEVRIRDGRIPFSPLDNTAAKAQQYENQECGEYDYPNTTRMGDRAERLLNILLRDFGSRYRRLQKEEGLQ